MVSSAAHEEEHTGTSLVRSAQQVPPPEQGTVGHVAPPSPGTPLDVPDEDPPEDEAPPDEEPPDEDPPDEEPPELLPESGPLVVTPPEDVPPSPPPAGALLPLQPAQATAHATTTKEPTERRNERRMAGHRSSLSGRA